jgi:hypothetical protein
VGGDEELGALLREVVHTRQRREAALGRERGLGLVHQVEAAGAEAVDEQVQERLAVRAFVGDTPP